MLDMYAPVLVTPPTSLPATLAQVKDHVNAQDFWDDDAKLTGYLQAAASYLDGATGILGICMVQQTWRQDFDSFHSKFSLSLGPVISITSIVYDDTDGVEQTIEADQYSLKSDKTGPYVKFVSGFTSPSITSEDRPIRITYLAGYATVPPALVQAVLLLVSHWYQNREAVITGQRAAAIELPMAVDRLISPFRSPHV